MVYLFKCNWWDIGIAGSFIFVDGHIITVNTANRWYTNDPFMLTDQGQQVVYLANPKKGGSWSILEGITNKNVYDVPLVLNKNVDEQRIFPKC